MHFDAELDAQGLLCPEPLMLVRNRIRDLQSGETLHILATDPSTERDLSNFCRFMNHEMIASTQTNDIYEFWIKKSA